uniref:Uncharacterized protein n=1 Tax=Meloidogyne enterolobii TaxID=390850 RepID=A0A6V7WQM6_MELEN|nr:unnamed protein product [Meloidogyne enterolobii]
MFLDYKLFNIIFQFLVERGCGKGPKLEINVLNVYCNGQLCNTKELFDKTFFCLNKGKEEKSLGAVICKERSCLVRRHFDGKLEQGCGKCPKDKINLSNIQCAQCHKIHFVILILTLKVRYFVGRRML